MSYTHTRILKAFLYPIYWHDIGDNLCVLGKYKHNTCITFVFVILSSS